MVSIKVRYENGQFIPLDEVIGIHEGDELEIQYHPPLPSQAEIEEIFAENRKIWDEEWQQRLSSL